MYLFCNKFKKKTTNTRNEPKRNLFHRQINAKVEIFLYFILL